MKGKQAIAEALRAEGVELMTGFPYNQIFDGAAEIGIRPIIARTERVAANIADGYSRASGGRRIGVCAVQYGPGAENVFGALAQAYADASPLLLLPSGYHSRELGVTPNFQATQNYGAVCKWVATVNHVDRVPQIMQHAFALLRNGKPGPVVVEMPDDLMEAELSADVVAYKPAACSRPAADPAQLRVLLDALSRAKAPMIIAGQGVLYGDACEELRLLAERLSAPVMSTLAGKSAFPEDHPLSLGAGGLSRPLMVDRWLAKTDFVLGVGTSFTRSHYTTQVPPGKTMAQITNEPRDIAKCHPIAHAVIGDVKSALAQLIAMLGHPAPAAGVAATVKAARDEFMRQWLPRLTSDAEPLSPYRVVWELMQVVDRRKTVITHDSGNPRDQILPFFETLEPHGYIGWGKSTQLGTGLGLIMGAKLARPEWLAVNLMGDAAFGMVGMDFETAVRERIPILTIVLNNAVMGGYEHHHPQATARYGIHRLSGDYAKVAEALGGFAQRVERVAELRPALERAIAATRSGRAALLEVRTREEPEFPVG